MLLARNVLSPDLLNNSVAHGDLQRDHKNTCSCVLKQAEHFNV